MGRSPTSARAVSPSAHLRLPIAIRGLRHPAAGGDGVRRAGDCDADRRNRRLRRGRRPADQSRRSRRPPRRDAAAPRRREFAPGAWRSWRRARETVSLGAQREADERAAGRGGERVRVGIDCRKIDDFGIGTYIRGLLNAMTGIEYVAFGPRDIALPAGIEHVVFGAPKYSIREL